MGCHKFDPRYPRISVSVRPLLCDQLCNAGAMAATKAWLGWPKTIAHIDFSSTILGELPEGLPYLLDQYQLKTVFVKSGAASVLQLSIYQTQVTKCQAIMIAKIIKRAFYNDVLNMDP